MKSIQFRVVKMSERIFYRGLKGSFDGERIKRELKLFEHGEIRLKIFLYLMCIYLGFIS